MKKEEKARILARHKKIISEACKEECVVTIVGYNAKKVLQQFDVLPVDTDFESDNINPFFRGFRVDKSGKMVVRDINKNNKISRFYLSRCSDILKAKKFNGLVSAKLNANCKFDPDLTKALDNYRVNLRNRDSFGWYVGTGTNLKKLDLIYGAIFEQHLLNNRKDLFKNTATYNTEREFVRTSSPKKFNRKISISFVEVKNFLGLIIWHLHDVKIVCPKKDKARLKKEINDYIKNNLVFA